jgi:hypothetical protein
MGQITVPSSRCWRRDQVSVVRGVADEMGFHTMENRHAVTDFNSTIWKPLGIESRKLEVPGRRRLVIDHDTPIDGIMA